MPDADRSINTGDHIDVVAKIRAYKDGLYLSMVNFALQGKKTVKV
jgi:hypothetical protein